MKNNKLGFTLIELIVVISILAILGTIAFISLQGYSADARNSKRVNNLGNISKSIVFKMIQGIKLEAFIKDRTNTFSGHVYGGVTSILGNNYDVGTLNYDTLGINETDFLDPDGNKYIIGISKKFSGDFEIAASVERKGYRVAKVTGSYNPRTSDSTQSDLLSGAGTKLISLAKNNGIRTNDTITTNGATPTTLIVKSLSSSNLGHRLTLSGVTPADTTNIKLLIDDTTGLIADKDDNTKIVFEGGSSLPY